MNFSITFLNQSVLSSGGCGRAGEVLVKTYTSTKRTCSCFILVVFKLGYGILGWNEILSQSRLPFVYPVCPRCGETTSLTIEGGQSSRRCTRCRWIETHGTSLVVTVAGHMFCKECGRFLLPAERVETQHGYCAVCQDSQRNHAKAE